MSTPKRIRNSIKKEALKASDFNQYKIPFACEDCVHFSSGSQNNVARCTLGNNTTEHRRDKQIESYMLSGRMAFCRLLEID